MAICLIIEAQTVPCEAWEIEPEDVLEITVYAHDDLSITTRVSADSEISFPLLGTISVIGKTVRELENEIEVLLDKDYIVNPHVVILTKEYHPNKVYVMGEVKEPQAIDLTKNKAYTILEVISMAGGFTDKANKNKIQIVRTSADGTKKNIIVKLTNIIKGTKMGRVNGASKTSIKSGDVIIVSERRF